MTEAWYLSGAFEKEADRLETQLQEYLDKKASFNDQISSCRARIVKLNKESENMEKKKAELEWEKSLPTRETIDQEAIRGVEHGEVSLQMGNKVNILEEASDLLNTRLAFFKAKLEDFKS